MTVNVIHPGHVHSAHDGDIHYIGYRRLVDLYRLNPKECVLYNKVNKYPDDAMHLYPRYDGEYHRGGGR